MQQVIAGHVCPFNCCCYYYSKCQWISNCHFHFIKNAYRSTISHSVKITFIFRISIKSTWKYSRKWHKHGDVGLGGHNIHVSFLCSTWGFEFSIVTKRQLEIVAMVMLCWCRCGMTNVFTKTEIVYLTIWSWNFINTYGNMFVASEYNLCVGRRLTFSILLLPHFFSFLFPLTCLSYICKWS